LTYQGKGCFVDSSTKRL